MVLLQDPVLFSGTLRSNLDPGGVHSEMRIASALQAAQLTSAVAGAGGLDAHMAEAGNNLSVGQRQLFCLARSASELPVDHSVVHCLLAALSRQVGIKSCC